jgi:hypothetical protein
VLRGIVVCFHSKGQSASHLPDPVLTVRWHTIGLSDRRQCFQQVRLLELNIRDKSYDPIQNTGVPGSVLICRGDFVGRSGHPVPVTT